MWPLSCAVLGETAVLWSLLSTYRMTSHAHAFGVLAEMLESRAMKVWKEDWQRYLRKGRHPQMSIVELALLLIAGFFGGYGLATWQNDAEKRRNRERGAVWLSRHDDAANRKVRIRK